MLSSKSFSFKKSARSFLFASFMVPTTQVSEWKIEQFSNIPKNEVSFSEKGLLVRVNASAGPLIYPLKSKTKITGFKITGEFRGLPKFAKPSLQGEKGHDDFAMRLGFVVPGDKQLTGLKKIFAAAWVKRLYEQVKDGSGIDSIRFFNVTQNLERVGFSRQHPGSDLLIEEFFASVKDSGPFSYDFQLKQPIDAVAIWISIDGDDTKSKYDVLISNLELRSP